MSSLNAETVMENTMLIVDDEEMNREILKVLFDKQYAILEAEDGEEALAVLERCAGSIDIVLLDLMMPNLSGLDILKRRQELDYFRNVPVVVITASGDMEDQVKSFEYGANDFVVKPFVPEIVESRVNNVMASYRRMLSIEREAKKLKIKSELDAMTGLFNKATTEAVVNDILIHEDRKQNVLFVIDIDNFKTVNDTSGHLSGDHVVKIISGLLASAFRNTDVVGRVGGDEFVVMMRDVPSMDIAYAKANELIQTMRYKPNSAIPEYVTLSIGITSNKGTTTTYAALFEQADEALYLAKKDGKARYREYGVEPSASLNDERPTAILLGNSRSVCASVHAAMPPHVRIVEALVVEDIELITPQDRQKAAMVFVDASELEDDAPEFWCQLWANDWIKPNQTIAICQEGNLDHMAMAIQNGVADMLLAPLDSYAFKRCVARRLEAYNQGKTR